MRPPSFDTRHAAWKIFLSSTMTMSFLIGWMLGLGPFIAPTYGQVQAAPDQEPVWSTEQVAYFESKVRPLLIEHCQACHGLETFKGGLQILSREHLLLGGDSGPAIEPGDATASLLIDAIKYESLQMPPDRKLVDAQVEILTNWVQMGAPWPGGDAPSQPRREPATVTEEDRQYWAFQPVLRPTLPSLDVASQPTNPIDSFILQKLADKKLRPNPPATPRELIRRATFDLLGLPPSPEDVETFVQQWNTERAAHPEREVLQVYLDLIDQLLARPEYGERWGRHWLDVVRFAQSNGYERDGEKQQIWKYRDYVIQAFNEDKPYNQFVIEQLAGDELPNATAASRAATGFYRLGVWDDEADDPRQAEYDDLDDIMVSTGAAFLGLTLGCCRCHDHKFDPLPQADYYRLLAYFRNVQRYTDPRPTLGSSTFLPTLDDATFASLLANHEQRRADAREKLETAHASEREALEAIVRDDTLPISEPDWTNGVRESGAVAPPVQLLVRGNASQAGPTLEPGVPLVFGGQSLAYEPIEKPLPSSGRRLALARWIADDGHPLTARVMVNRIWYHHFGTGIVPTTTDFGVAGLPPTHPELLDWLAAEFVQQGWSVKSMHRLMMTSQVYQRSSQQQPRETDLGSRRPTDASETEDAAVKDAAVVDPGNQWYWRGNLRRLNAEAVRDSMLTISGQLNSERGGRGFFPHLAGEVLSGSSRPGSGWGVSDEQQQNRRSVYMFVKRTLSSPWLDLFDYNNLTQPIAERSVTTVAPQALMLLNDDFMLRQASALAARVRQESGDNLELQLARAFELAVQRAPTDSEQTALQQFALRQKTAAQHLKNRVTLRPDVPLALHEGYLRQLQPRDCLLGPPAGWSYLKGRWEGGYEGIVNQNLDFGPAAIWEGATLGDGSVTTQLVLGRSTEFASLVMRGIPDGDSLNGLEIRLIPASDRLEVAKLQGQRQLLGHSSIPLATGEPIQLRVSIEREKIRVWVDETNVAALEVIDPEPRVEPGRIGFRVWGAPLAVDQLVVETTTGRVELEQPDASATAGLVAACLLILNLNEVIYVD